MRSISLPNAEVRVHPDAAALSQAAADEVRRAALAAVGARDRCAIALSGGSTPKAVYSTLAAKGPAGFPWDRVHLFLGDERAVLADHAESNFRMVNEALLARVPIPADCVHRIRTELGAPRAAAEYEAEIRRVFGSAPGAFPRFDLVLLGLGTDGHTASLFPGSAGLEERSALVCANWVERLQAPRITLTFPVLNAAREVLFLVSGEEKSAVLRSVLRGNPSGRTYPAQLVRPAEGRLIWMVDEAAARESELN